MFTAMLLTIAKFRKHQCSEIGSSQWARELTFEATGFNRSSTPHLPSKILKVYVETLVGFSHAFGPEGLNSTLFSQGCVLGNGSGCECLFQGREEVGTSYCPNQLSGQPGVTSSQWAPLTTLSPPVCMASFSSVCWNVTFSGRPTLTHPLHSISRSRPPPDTPCGPSCFLLPITLITF